MEYDKKILGLEYITDNIKVLRFKRVAVRDYIFLMQKEHEKLFDETFNKLINKPYSFLFEIYDSTSTD
ncbi:MAG: hypothetical protein MIO93_04085 [ANME-2 cluster archaeon]|jgi:hypothetical protein|nr:hypothetical protein [ANME-2 cluster archaeon]